MPKLRKLIPSGTLAGLNSQSISSVTVSPRAQPWKSYVREGGQGCMSWDGKNVQVNMGFFLTGFWLGAGGAERGVSAKQ